MRYVLLLTVLISSTAQGCINEVFKTRENSKQLVSLQLQAREKIPQRAPVKFPCSGTYEVTVHWELLNGPGSGSEDLIRVSGAVNLLNNQGATIHQIPLKHDVVGSSMGWTFTVELAHEEIEDVKYVELAMANLPPTFYRHYKKVKLSVRRILKYRLLD